MGKLFIYLFIFFCNTPDIRRMWGYIVFAFLFIRSYIRSFVFPSQGQSFCVKVYKTSYFEDPLMDFIHIWHDGRYRSKVFISTIPTPGVTLGSRSRTSNFHKKVRVKVFALKFIRPHILKTLWWISFIFGMMVDIGLKFISAPSPPRWWPWGQGHGLRIFIKKSKFFMFKFI